jgi:tryptophan halogenase
MIGQGIVPVSYSPLVDRVPMPELAEFMQSVKGTIAACVDAMPMHQAFIDRHCKAGTVQ